VLALVSTLDELTNLRRRYVRPDRQLLLARVDLRTIGHQEPVSDRPGGDE
jgi:hypothetical protein